MRLLFMCLLKSKKLFWYNFRNISLLYTITLGRGQLKCAGTRPDITFRLSAKRTSPFKSAGVSVQSNTGSRGVRISGSNVGYTVFRGSVKSTGYPHHSSDSPSLLLPASPCAITLQLDSTSYALTCCVRKVKLLKG